MSEPYDWGLDFKRDVSVHGRACRRIRGQRLLFFIARTSGWTWRVKEGA